jgi:RimJ/RimL family protein N-acetyltransferase
MFEGKLARLAPITRDDLERFVRWFNDPEFLRFLSPLGIRLISYEDEVEWYENMRKDKDNYVYAIRTLAEDKLIGSCGLHRVDWRNRKALFGIGVGDRSYWGRGYGTDATRVLMEYAFDELNLNRVFLEVYDFNARAIHSYEKVGFVREGTLRQDLFRDGAYHDTYIMGLLREDWLAGQASS